MVVQLWYSLDSTWLVWNISGLDTVELTYRDGKKFRIGTDEPEVLLDAQGCLDAAVTILALSFNTKKSSVIT